MLNSTGAGAQQPNISSFTIKEGLPSNHVYRCVEDDHGFLWVATDAGIARFDGKNFQVFTTEHGLPDNEVLSVVKEQNGRIWVNCFRQSPSYFDEKKNRFINARQDSNLAKLSGTTGMYLFSFPGGGVLYHSAAGSYLFKDDKLTLFESKARSNFPVKINPDKSYIHWGMSLGTQDSNNLSVGLYHKKGNSVVDSFLKSMGKFDMPIPFLNDGKLFIFVGVKQKCYIFSDIKSNPLRFSLDSILVPEKFSHSDFTPTSFYILGASGKLYVYDKVNLQLRKVVEGQYLPNSYYDDKQGNEWISTIDKGLLAYRRNQVARINLPLSFTGTNFLSVARKPDGTVLAGNYYGEIIKIAGSDFSIHKITPSSSRQRKIILNNGNVFSFSELGTFLNYTQPVLNPLTQKAHPSKTAVIFNDSTIMVGYTTGMLRLNTRTLEIQRLSVNNKRITAIACVNDSIIYFGSTDGLYKYNIPKDRTVSLSGKNNVPDHRVTALTYTKDGLLWMATAGEGLVVLKDEKFVRSITTTDGILHNSIRSMSAGKEGTLWLGTSRGVSILRYSMQKGLPLVTSQNLTINDGLTSNEINDIWAESDSVYLATADGISIVPPDIKTAALNIPLKIIDVMINEKHVSIMPEYTLGSEEQNIAIRVAGIDLGGHFSHIQYLLDQNGEWISSYENTLNFQLAHGDHLLQIRAVDVNGAISRHILTVNFNIDIPFWRSFWFLAGVLLLLQLLVIYIILKRRRKISRVRVARQIASVQTAALEQQAFTSLMNPHFIFNALNSVQHYINLQDRQNANRYLSDFASLIRKNFEAAQKSFIPLEEELESIRIYLRLEQMRFREKFRYTIEVDDGIDTEEWMIPTMMIQPLMENAILHGIMPATIPGELALKVSIHGGDLQISITDNGIGLKNSLEKKGKSQHRSRSVELIQKRMSALNHFTKQPIRIEVSTFSDSEQNPGTRTTILLPKELYITWKQAHKTEELANP